jgi:outer membrane protein OmpA-like peptidoglycan-associated protein
MENQLLKEAKDFFNEEVLARIGQRLDQNKEQVRQGVDVTLPALFLGLSKQSETAGGITGILDQAKQHFSGFDLNALLDTDAAPNGAVEQAEESQAPRTGDMLTAIFGGGLDTVLNSVAGYLGFSGAAVRQLMSLSLPAIFSSLTNRGQHWDADAIGQHLRDNKASFAAALPAGLGLGAFGKLADGGMFSTSETNSGESHAGTIPVESTQVHGDGVKIDPATELGAHKEPLSLPRSDESKAVVTATNSSGSGWWKILIALIIVLLLWFLFGKGCSSGKKEGATDTSVNPVEVDSGAGAVGSALPSAGREQLDVMLPEGTKLTAFKGGIEDRLVEFLKSDYKSLGEDSLKNTWFDFDNLNFKTGTATVLPESEVQLQNLAAILKAFPTAQVKIGGYTDKTGNEDLNKKLSRDRANAVKEYLDKAGLAQQVIGAEGYGSQFAKYPADAPEADRILDRHVAVSVR